MKSPENKDCRSEEHTSELQSRQYLVCRLLLEKTKVTYSASGDCTTQTVSAGRLDRLCWCMKGARQWYSTGATDAQPGCSLRCCFFFLMMRRPARSTLFPHPALFQ